MANSIQRALISVSDKTGLEDLVLFLKSQNIQIISTGGTFQTIRAIDENVMEVSSFTGHPEMMDGRVKTLHPKIHAGILNRGEEDKKELNAMDYESIDLVVVNLYPFQETIKKNVSESEAIENIDIGGPTMIRAAAKNFNRVTVLSDPLDYQKFIDAWDANHGISLEFRKQMAQKVFAKMSEYDRTIAEYLNNDSLELSFGKWQLDNLKKLRYGENPHQAAFLQSFSNLPHKHIANSQPIQGKELSFNNLVDADAAFECVKAFQNPACVIVKHANPCGVGESTNILTAYELAFETDPTSAFGGVIAFNKKVTKETAQKIIDKQFVEIIIAPKFATEAINILSTKPNIRVLEVDLDASDPHPYVIKKIDGGLLWQDLDNLEENPDSFKVVSNRKPSDQEVLDLWFAWRVAKFVKSNAIVFAKNGQTIGIGAGQMSRVVSAEIAALKAKDAGLESKNSAMASDAFFPFRDGIDQAAKVGISAIIQPGGSMRDEEVIAAANEHNMTMIFTGTRHFRH
jgi:phosphoribosylaminoimidazolecarboxamide formyltransferase/IMP cyclohydrolase